MPGDLDRAFERWVIRRGHFEKSVALAAIVETTSFVSIMAKCKEWQLRRLGFG